MDKMKLSNHISKASVGKLYFAVALRVWAKKNVSLGPRFKSLFIINKDKMVSSIKSLM